MPIHRNPKLTADGLVLYDGRLVLVRRGREPYRGRLALPGGFVEYGETTEAAAVREVREETGLATEVVRLVVVSSRPDRDPRGHTVSVIYELSHVGGEPRAGDDAAAVVLLTLAEARRAELAFDHGEIVAAWLAEREA